MIDNEFIAINASVITRTETSAAKAAEVLGRALAGLAMDMRADDNVTSTLSVSKITDDGE